MLSLLVLFQQLDLVMGTLPLTLYLNQRYTKSVDTTVHPNSWYMLL